MVGRVIGARFAELRNEVTIGTRNVEALLARTEPDAMGNEPFAAWKEQHPEIALGMFAEAAAAGELVVNATIGAGSLDALHAAGEQNLNGKVLIDIANPLDASRGMLPSLFVSNTDSLGEQIQRTFPDTRVVKALNTMNCEVMVDPARVPGEHDVFLSGNDEVAKADVRELLESFGWPATRIVDLGDITAARGTEMYLPLWLRLWGAVQTGYFNIKVVR
jgi:hypothetical protein